MLFQVFVNWAWIINCHCYCGYCDDVSVGRGQKGTTPVRFLGKSV